MSTILPHCLPSLCNECSTISKDSNRNPKTKQSNLMDCVRIFSKTYTIVIAMAIAIAIIIAIVIVVAIARLYTHS
jgi:predicted nucleic acid binding AN1-type Zn finger protein